MISMLMFIVLLIVGFSLPAYAQKESGSIVGRVSDMDNLPLEGVTVTASSPSLIGGTATTYTDEDGNYRFPVLPPGTYEVTASLEGFQTASRNDVRVSVGKTITVNHAIGQTMEEAIEVSAETLLVDSTTPASPKTVDIGVIENLPKFSFALDLFTLTPGVNDLTYVAYGAGGSQANGYWFDGVDISNPVGGSYWIYPNYNWIEEVQVVGIGAPAEYGGFSGVITNSVSRSGSNEYHGLFQTVFENQSLVSNNSDDPSLAPDRVDLYTDTTAQLGGRIIKDKLWFFGSYEYYYSRTAPSGYPPEGPESFVTFKQPRVLGKLTYKANENNTLQGFYQWDDYFLDGQAADSFTLPEATGIAKAPESFWNTSWVSLFSPNTYLDVRYSGYDSDYDILPRNGETPQHGDAVTGLLTDNYWRNYLTDRTRQQLNASLSHYARDFMGSHDFKFGIEYEHSNANRSETYTGGVYYYDYGGQPYYRYLWDGYDSLGRIRRTSVFAQDNWHITNNLDLSIGVRWDHNYAYLDEAPDINYTTNPVAPRIGIVYDIKGDQKTIVKAHYGNYYDKAITFYIDGIDDFGDRTTQYWYGSYWGDVNFAPGDSYWVVDPDLKQPYVQQFTVGIDQAMPKGVTIGANYIYRSFKDFIEDVDTTGIYEPVPFFNPITGETITAYEQVNADDPQTLFISNPGDLFRTYNAVEIYGGKRFSNKLTLNGSVVWSRTRGNTSNTDDGADGFTNLFDNPNYFINAEGSPPIDPTWEIKINGYYELPWQILTSFYYRHFTGDTWTPRLRTDFFEGASGTRVYINGLPLGSERLPSRNVFDFRLQKSFPISRGNMNFTMDIFNLFNTGYPLEVETRYERGNYGEATEFSSPREITFLVGYQF